MSKQQAISASFSQEELFVMLSYMQVPELLGLDNTVWEDLAKEQIGLVLGVAERALVARSVLIPEGTKLKLADLPHALVRTCTNPEKSLLLSCSFPEQEEQNYYFHLARKMLVLHTIPFVAIHQFIALENAKALIRSAMSILSLKDFPELQCGSGRVPDEVMTQAREKSQEGLDVSDILTASGLEKAVAEELTKTLKNPQLNHSLVFIQHLTGREAQVDGFALLGGVNGLWMLYPEESAAPKSKDMIIIKPTTTQEISQKLSNYLL